MKRVLKGVGIALGVLLLLGIGGFIWLVNLLGHRFYVVTGRATISAAAVEHVQVPALICVGRGGPLQSSGVYGAPLGYKDETRTARVFCSQPKAAQTFDYEQSVYYGKLPREMHVYVWLEHHPELVDACRDASSPVIAVDPAQLRGHLSDRPADQPCFKPDRNGSVGYAVAFRTDVFEDGETLTIDVKPKGYP